MMMMMMMMMNHRRSQTMAEPIVAINFVERKCQMYARVVLVSSLSPKATTTSASKPKEMIGFGYGFHMITKDRK